MYAIQPNGRNNRKIIDDAISARVGNRGAVWLNTDRFVYIDRDGQSRVYSMTTGKSTPALTRNGKYHLLSPLLNYACDRYHFHPFDRTTKTIRLTGPRLDGCESYFTHDGRWGFRMNGAGGPIARVDLATSQLYTLLEKHDARMPKDRGYVYFPMTSSCRRLLAFGASPDQHDHFNSDYDIFVAKIDPDTLDVRDNPVRYTFDSKTDRYPDVYLAPLDFGPYSGEAPLNINFSDARFDAKQGRSWKWDYGDGTEGDTPSHRYTQSGRYAVSAQKGHTKLRGVVTVREPEPPHAERATLRDATTLWLRFNEPVNVDNLKLSLASGIAVTSPQLSADGRELLATLATPLAQDDTLHITGIRDRAQQPNPMPPTDLPLANLRWPVDRSSCIWAWQTRKMVLPEAFHGRVDARGIARYTHHGAMDTFGGAFKSIAPNDDLSGPLKESGEFTLELTLTSQNVDKEGLARVVSLSNRRGAGNFTLYQQKGELVFQMRSSQPGVPNSRVRASLMTLDTNETTHVAVTYAPGRLTAYRNGEQVMQADPFQGDFSTWKPASLFIGDRSKARPNWIGTIEGLAFYDRALTSDAIKKSALAYQLLRMERPAVKTHQVTAKLLSRSTPPTLAEIAPYEEALSLHEFEITKSESDDLPVGKRIRGAAWVWLRAKAPPIVDTPPLTEMQLTLTPFQDNPQLKSIFLSDTLDFDVDIDVYYLVRP